jgi:glycosyltransferase involved in cell wall biosynthesis
MRVLYFTGSYRPDSMISHTHGELVAAIRARGVQIEMLTTAPTAQQASVATITDPFGNRVWYVRPNRGPLDRFARTWSVRHWRHAPFLGHVAALKAFFTPERRSAYDLLHVGMVFPYGTIVRKALNGAQQPPTIVTITGGDVLTDAETGYGYTRAPAIRREVVKTLRWAGLVQANSPLTASVARTLGGPPDRTAILPPHSPVQPVERSALAEYRARSGAQLRKAGAVPPGRFMLGLGRMERIKGYDDVVRAMPAILKECPDVTLVLAGPARSASAQAYAADLMRLANGLGMDDRILVKDRIPHEQVPEFMAAAEIIFVPSLLDGLNQTGLEGGAVGTPCIASERAGIAWYVREHAAGQTVPARNPDAIAHAAIPLLTDREAWARASAGAYAMTEAFSLDRTAEAAIGLYERVLNTGERPATVLYSRPATPEAGGGDEDE